MPRGLDGIDKAHRRVGWAPSGAAGDDCSAGAFPGFQNHPVDRPHRHFRAGQSPPSPPWVCRLAARGRRLLSLLALGSIPWPAAGPAPAPAPAMPAARSLPDDSGGRTPGRPRGGSRDRGTPAGLEVCRPMSTSSPRPSGACAAPPATWPVELAATAPAASVGTEAASRPGTDIAGPSDGRSRFWPTSPPRGRVHAAARRHGGHLLLKDLHGAREAPVAPRHRRLAGGGEVATG